MSSTPDVFVVGAARTPIGKFLGALGTLKASDLGAVALKEAMDMDKALQTAINDLRNEFNTLFGRYNALLAELSTLHITEAMLAAKTKR